MFYHFELGKRHVIVQADTPGEANKVMNETHRSSAPWESASRGKVFAHIAGRPVRAGDRYMILYTGGRVVVNEP